MDDVARLPPADRADLFSATAGRRRLRQEIVEKDFWVCWSLKRLFTLSDPPAGLIFKGGTSLSKVFNAIERFSEDVNLSFNRVDLGFGGEHDPLHAPSGKKARQWREALTETCRRVIYEQLLPQLTATFAESIGAPPGVEWRLQLDPEDANQQTLLFHYPSGNKPREADEAGYIKPFVRLEIGARSDHWPSLQATVIPYAAEEFPKPFRDPVCSVRVLAAERTFWEKATLLHAWHHAPASKAFRDRQSRHYYDVVRLYEKGIGKEALRDIELLLKVAEHKDVFFPAASAKYEEARPGTLRLVPPWDRLPELEQDYRKMQEMIFAEPPSLDHILDVLKEIEALFNRPADS